MTSRWACVDAEFPAWLNLVELSLAPLKSRVCQTFCLAVISRKLNSTPTSNQCEISQNPPKFCDGFHLEPVKKDL